MYKTGYILVISCHFLVCQISLFGQGTFQKSFGDPTIQSEAIDVVEGPEGYLIGGFTSDPETGRDGLLIYLDFQGNVIWEKAYDMNGVDEFKAVALANDGGFIVLGITDSPNDLWLLKISPAGAIVWQKQFDQPNGGIGGTRLQAVPGGYVLSGLKGFNNGSSNPYTIRVDNNGNVLWSNAYQVTNGLFSIAYVTDSLLYAGGVSNFNAVFLAIDPATGIVVKNKTYTAPGTESLDYIAPAADGNLLLADYAQLNWPSNQIFQWVQKVTPAGDVIWSKIYDFSSLFHFNGPIVRTIDGGFLVLPGDGSNAATLDAYLMKIDGNGDVDWCHAFGKPNGQEWFRNAIQTSDGGFLAVGITLNGGQLRTNVFVVKTDANGRIDGCCPQKITVKGVDFATTTQTTTYTSLPFADGVQAFGSVIPRSFGEQTHTCSSYQPATEINIALCPGETVLLGGQPYTQPDTVTLEIPAANGACDTLATYFLTDATVGQSSEVGLQCPSNIVKTVPAGVLTTPITYALPTATSDCTCPDIELTRTMGGESGSNFSIGGNTVCWLAKDACGTTKTCCFTVTVSAETSACDTKTTPCLKWELISVNRDAHNQSVYTIRLTNTCAAALTYAYFGLPAGIVPVSPNNNSVYSAASGRQYDVRSPNFSPVYGLRFKSQSTGLQTGQSEVFRFTLPQQTRPDYCYVAGKLDNAAFYEAYLNTFYCPVGVESGADNRNSESATTALTDLTLAPNPAMGGAILHLTGRAVASGELRLINAAGQQIFYSDILDNQVMLKSELPDGIYFFQVLEQGAMVKNGKLLVIR